MRPLDLVPNLAVTDIDASRAFWQDFIGLEAEEFNLGWVARFTSPDGRASLQLVAGDATAAEDSAISIHTRDVEAAYAEAVELGYEIVHPLTTEPWGVHRFFVRSPDGHVINIVGHPQ